LVLPIKADQLTTEVRFNDWLLRELGISEEPAIALTRLASKHPLVVVLDQLDALASLVDLTSDRLNQILLFIQTIKFAKNIGVVCSCRAFDFQHDVRFQSIFGNQITLELPSWNDVRGHLIEAGVAEPNQFPEAMRGMLRNPQHLKVYMDHFRNGTQRDSYLNYYELLDDLWKLEVNTEPKRELIYELTSQCIAKETLDIPYLKFESSESILTALLASEILVTNGKTLGFRHQTMLEYAKARLFVRDGHRLKEFVVDPQVGGMTRQDSIQVRPTVWSVLVYLRQVSIATYELQLEELFKANLRLHVRYLLIDFLGQCDDPTDLEVGILASRLSFEVDWKRVLWAVRNSEPWFRKLQATHLPSEMNREELWPIVGVLMSAIKFEHRRVLELLQLFWYANPSMDEQTIRVLKELEQWDNDSVGLALTLIGRAIPSKQLQWWANDMFRIVARNKPDLSPSLFLCAMNRQSTIMEPSVLFRDRSGWHDLSETIRNCEMEFCQEVWPWFVSRANEAQDHSRSRVTRRYYSSLSLQEVYSQKRPILEAIHSAMVAFAKSDSNRFQSLARPSFGSESLLVHQVLCSAIAANTEELHSLALEYFLKDDRHFAIGDLVVGDKHYSCTLLTAIGDELDDSKLGLLVDSISNSSEYDPGIKLSDEQIKCVHTDRQILLKSLPFDRLPKEIKERFQLELVEVPFYGDVSQDRCGSVIEIPPIPADRVDSASDEEILGSLTRPVDVSSRKMEWIEEEQTFREAGGPLSQARVLVGLAREQPDRVIRIMKKMAGHDHDDVLTTILDGLDGLESKALFTLIKELSDLGCKSEYFRSKCASMVYSRSKSGIPLEVSNLLKEWLRATSAFEQEPKPLENSSEEQNEFDTSGLDDYDEVRVEAKAAEKPQSILRTATINGTIDPYSVFTFLAVSNGYLAIAPADPNGWLRFVGELIDTTASEKIWRLVCQEQRWKLGGDQKLAESVFEQLFKKRPRVAFCNEGVQFVGWAAKFLSPSFASNYMKILRSNFSQKAQQAYGELLPVFCFCDNKHNWADKELEEVIEKIAVDSICQKSINIGLAFVTSYFWAFPAVREKCCDVLCRLIPIADDNLISAIGTVFHRRENLCVDPCTEKLLQTIAQNPQVLVESVAEDLMQLIKPIAQFYRSEVLSICRSIVTAKPKELTSMAYSIFAIGPMLVDISLTLQRFSDTRSEALNLFEDLLRIGLAEANATLNEKDLRLGFQPVSDGC